MTTRLEHANLVVRDVDAMIDFIETALPEFSIRGRGKNLQGRRWVHIGTDSTYLALNEASEEAAEQWIPYGGKPGLNHLGYEVDDADGLRTRMLAAGYRDSTVPNAHPSRRRVYFHDREGNDWEFVEYASTDPAERNDYSLPD